MSTFREALENDFSMLSALRGGEIYGTAHLPVCIFNPSDLDGPGEILETGIYEFELNQNFDRPWLVLVGTTRGIPWDDLRRDPNLTFEFLGVEVNTDSRLRRAWFSFKVFCRFLFQKVKTLAYRGWTSFREIEFLRLGLEVITGIMICSFIGIICYLAVVYFFFTTSSGRVPSPQSRPVVVELNGDGSVSNVWVLKEGDSAEVDSGKVKFPFEGRNLYVLGRVLYDVSASPEQIAQYRRGKLSQMTPASKAEVISK